jgi:hypothetical protein
MTQNEWVLKQRAPWQNFLSAGALLLFFCTEYRIVDGR